MAIEKIIENIEAIQSFFKKYNFTNVRLFKGFGFQDERNFYLAAGSEDLSNSDTNKKLLTNELTGLFGWYVGIDLDQDMKAEYLDFINKPNQSVNLSETIEKAALKNKLESYFGQEWEFNKKNPNINSPTSLLVSTPIFAPPVKKPLEDDTKKVKDLIEQVKNLTPNELESFKQQLSSFLKSSILESKMQS